MLFGKVPKARANGSVKRARPSPLRCCSMGWREKRQWKAGFGARRDAVSVLQRQRRGGISECRAAFSLGDESADWGVIDLVGRGDRLARDASGERVDALEERTVTASSGNDALVRNF